MMPLTGIKNTRVRRLTIVKIGGEILDNSTLLSSSLKSFTALPGARILVHGGGTTASRMSVQLGVTPQLVQGRRVTDAGTLKIVQMVYAGLLNKNIVCELQSLGCNALGMTGADGNSILAVKRSPEPVDYGYAGDITEVNCTLLKKIIELDLVPVFCSLTHDGRNQFLNTNADTMAARLGIALSGLFTVDIIYCFGKPGVLINEYNEKSVIEKITWDSFRDLKRRDIIRNGMIPKLENAFEALRGGVKRIRIIHPDALGSMAQEKTKTGGTLVTLD
jgi:acetylglutamate kinase